MAATESEGVITVIGQMGEVQFQKGVGVNKGFNHHLP